MRIGLDDNVSEDRISRALMPSDEKWVSPYIAGTVEQFGIPCR